ncbi:MAG: YHYH protein [Verrucomicrobiales bacterium]
MKVRRVLLLSALFAFSLTCLAQRPGGGPPPMRKHTATTAASISLIPATEDPPSASRHEFSRTKSGLSVSSNGIPEHLVGMFPNRGNPHTIRPQGYEIVLPSDPKPAAAITKMERTPFGIALNGVFLDPGAAEYWQGEPERGWQYEALGGAVPLGLDENQAHVQPSGAYHYHGIPEALAKRLGSTEGKHSPLVGWAADGFPVYVRFGFVNPKDPKSEVATLKSSWRLKSGTRPDGAEGPGGTYDGAFVQDYEFIDGSGDLDECNGRFCITPEFPEGTYAYFLTDEWPVIPRAFRGTPVRLRMEGPPGGPRPDRGR